MILYGIRSGISERTSVKMLRIAVLPEAERPNNMKPCLTSDVSNTSMIFLVNCAVLMNYGLFLMMTGILL